MVLAVICAPHFFAGLLEIFVEEHPPTPVSKLERRIATQLEELFLAIIGETFVEGLRVIAVCDRVSSDPYF